MDVIAIDLETSIKCPVGNNKANPMWLGNKIIAIGTCNDGFSGPVHAYSSTGLTHSWYDLCNHETYEAYLVGHNIKFDLCYLYRNHITNKLPTFWDTQLAEYIITGQRSKYASLDELTEKYIGAHAKKDTIIADYWNNGADTEDIPKEELLAYLDGDTSNTLAIFKKQWQIANAQGQLALILSQMDALRATTAMNLAGMAIDWEYARSQKEKYNDLITITNNGIQSIAKGLDPSSTKQLSLFFFGGVKKILEREQVGFYKNGNPRFKAVAKEVPIVGHIDPVQYGLTANKNGYYSTDESTLDKISKDSSVTTLVKDVAKSVSALRLYSKIAETYYQGLLDLQFPNCMLYPQLNHCATGTGRLSCVQPNLQNQTTTGDVKRSFISRHGNEGYLLELDYSQLEVVWLAYLSQDTQLIEDINKGVDIHSALFVDMYGRSPTKDERKEFKPRTFQLIYGAGPTAISEQGGIPLAEAKRFIKVFYDRYRGVKQYHEETIRKADVDKEVFYVDKEPNPHYSYSLQMPWGRHYNFVSYHNDWKGGHSLSPTELKNYPIQGSATGDHVPLILGILQRELEKLECYKEGKALLIMTVHDSILLDVHGEVLYTVAALAKKVMEDAPYYLKKHFNIDFPCKLNVGVSFGRNWQDMEDIK